MASIKKRPDGRYRARYRDEAGREHARHFAKQSDAQGWLDEVTAALVTGTYADPKAGSVTFAAYYKGWSARQVWEPGTVKAMNLAARSVTFGDVQLRRLRRSHVESWVKSMTANLAPGTVKTRFNNVRSVLRGAVRDRVIGTDPSEDVRLPRVRRAEAAMNIPEPAQVRQLLDAAEVQFRPLVAVCAFAGLRLGEVAALRVGDIDFLGRSLSVSRQVQRENGGLVDIKEPKYGSERVVYVPDELAVILSEHIARCCRGAASDRWLFSAGEQPWHQNTVGYYWHKARDRSGVEGFTLHDLRHFYASGLIAAGCDVVTVQRALGHAKATTTLNTYAHLWPTAGDRTRTAAAGIMAAVADSANLADSSRTTEPVMPSDQVS